MVVDVVMSSALGQPGVRLGAAASARAPVEPVPSRLVVCETTFEPGENLRVPREADPTAIYPRPSDWRGALSARSAPGRCLPERDLRLPFSFSMHERTRCPFRTSSIHACVRTYLRKGAEQSHRTPRALGKRDRWLNKLGMRSGSRASGKAFTRDECHELPPRRATGPHCDSAI